MRERGGLVGRRAVGRLGVGRSFPKKNFDSGVGQKKWNKNCPQKKTELGNRNWADKKKGPEEKKY
jgi:hypothetical protein